MAIQYTLSMPRPHAHLFEVEVRIPAADGPLDLVLPVWTPGSYLIREYARNVQDFTAHDSAGLRIGARKTSKNVWRVVDRASGPTTVRYRMYANELTVRTSHLDDSHGYVNGASVFMYPRGMEDEPVTLRIAAPQGWRVATSLHESDAGEFLAENYDELVDCPIEIGPHRTIAWVQEGVPHRFAIWGDADPDEKRLVDDTRRIIDVCAELFGGIPYERFLFLVHSVPDGRGGLEHKNSCSLHVSPSWWRDPDYESLLVLTAHEFFHVWMGKRIRPQPLGPFDYSGENYTRHLWVVEGFTTYYAELICLRAGLLTPGRFLDRLGDAIARLQANPGRFHQSLEESSFDTWIKFYRPDSHTPNSQVSYYHKGALVALALDLEIRRASGGARSLDDVMRVLWERFGRRDVAFPEDEGIRPLLAEVLGSELSPLLEDYISGRVEIDFDSHLSAVGLALAEREVAVFAEGASRAVPPFRPAPPTDGEWKLGLRVQDAGGRLRVLHVLEDGPAWNAGVNAGDEILAVDGRRATAAALKARTAERSEGDEIELTVLRRDMVRGVTVRLEQDRSRLASIVERSGATPAERVLRRGWLGA